MRIATLTLAGLGLIAAAGPLYAQEPRPPGVTHAVDAVIGNSVLQLRYLTPAPIARVAGDLDYGLLLSENRDIVASAALMFHTDLDILPRLSLEIGPQGYVGLLAAQQKTDIFAIAGGANARYELIERIGLTVFGSAFYSPGVLTFGNAHNLYDFTAGAELKFTSRITGLAGYRWFKLTLVGEPDERVANEVFAGLRWRLE
ncbi:MAG: YfaZ family outer membrane protein [Steroidobacteraceae bacterium]